MVKAKTPPSARKSFGKPQFKSTPKQQQKFQRRNNDDDDDVVEDRGRKQFGGKGTPSKFQGKLDKSPKGKFGNGTPAKFQGKGKFDKSPKGTPGKFQNKGTPGKFEKGGQGKFGNKQQAKQTPQQKKSKVEEEDLEEESDDSFEEELAPKQKQQLKGAVSLNKALKRKIQEEESDDEEEESDDESADEKPQKANGKAQTPAKAQPKAQEKTPAKAQEKTPAKAQEKTPAKAQPKAQEKTPAKKPAKKEASDESDSSDEAPQAKKAKKSVEHVAKEQTKELHKALASKNQNLGSVPNELLAENEDRLKQQKKRSIFVALPGNLRSVSDSALKALHPDVLNVNRIANAAFLIFSSEAVRDKAFPVVQKAQLKKKPIKIDYCCEKSQKHNPRRVNPKSGLNLSQLVITDMPSDTSKNTLEIIFPKAIDFKVIHKKNLAYLNFANEAEALEAFKKGKGLKISSCPVVVRFRSAEIVDGANGQVTDENAKPKVVEQKKVAEPKAAAVKKQPEPLKKKVEESSDEEMEVDAEDSDLDALGESDEEGEEGFEEVFEEVEVEESDLEDAEDGSEFGEDSDAEE